MTCAVRIYFSNSQMTSVFDKHTYRHPRPQGQTLRKKSNENGMMCDIYRYENSCKWMSGHSEEGAFAQQDTIIKSFFRPSYQMVLIIK